MKKIMTILSVAVPLLARAQGTVYVSNLGNPPAGSGTIGNDSWIAQEFTWLGTTVDGVETTPNLTFNSVQLLMNTASGSPSGFTVSIYSTLNNASVGNSLGTLSGSANPSSDGVYTYTTPGITLSPSAEYLVVVTTGTPTAQGAYNWSFTTSHNQSRNSNLVINDGYFISTDGSSWTEIARQNIFQLAIFGTPVPEPSAAALIFLAGGVLVCVRARRRRRVSES